MGYMSDYGSNVSDEIIVILSMTFTLVSICIGICKFYLSKQIINIDSRIIVSFEAKCDDFTYIHPKTFNESIVFRQISLKDKIGTLLKIESDDLERLQPIQTENGAIFVLFLPMDPNQNNQNLIQGHITNGEFSRAIQQSYDLKNEPIIANLLIKNGNTGSQSSVINLNAHAGSGGTTVVPTPKQSAPPVPQRPPPRFRSMSQKMNLVLRGDNPTIMSFIVAARSGKGRKSSNSNNTNNNSGNTEVTEQAGLKQETTETKEEIDV